MQVDVRLFGVVWEHMIADEATEHFAVWYLEMLFSLFLISSAQSQYRGNSVLLLLNIALAPKRLSVEFISTLQCQKTSYKIFLVYIFRTPESLA